MRDSSLPDPILSNLIKDPKGADGKARPLEEGSQPRQQTIIDAGTEFGLTAADIEKMIKRFKPYYRANGQKRVDWDAQLLSWCADEAKRLDRFPIRPEETEVEKDPRWVPIRAHFV